MPDPIIDPTVTYETPPDLMPTDAAEAAAAPIARPIVAGPGGEHRVKRILLAVLLGGYGLWSLYDGFVKMPADNAAARQKTPGIDPQKVPHPGWDIPFNRTLGVALPPLAVALVAWAWFASRGQMVLDERDVLHAPGHPPVPLADVVSVDRSRWDRKGIAVVKYQMPGGKAGQLKLDDFLYQRGPTDDIYDCVLASLEGSSEQPGADERLP